MKRLDQSVHSVETRWGKARAGSWSLVGPPARPSRSEVDRYAALLGREIRRGASRCLILGSTPELRGLCHELGLQVTCADWSYDLYDGMAPLLNTSGPERFIESSWLDLDLEQPVDLVLGDGVLNMVEPEHQGALVRKAHSFLGDRGLAILRIHVIAEPRFESPIDVFSWWRETRPHPSAFTATRTHLDMLWLDEESRGVDLALTFERVSRLHAAGEIHDVEFDHFARLSGFFGITVYYSDPKILESQLAPYFDLEDRVEGDDYPCANQHALHALRKR